MPTSDQGDPPIGDGDHTVESGLPGVAVRGYPGFRAGAFGYGNGLLGLYHVTDGQIVDGSGSSPGYQTISWRDTDPQANAYDLYTAKRDLGEAQTIGNLLGWGGKGQAAASLGAKYAPRLGLAGIAKSLGALASPELGAAGLVVGDFMNEVDVPRLQNKINALQARQKQFPQGS